MNGQPQSGFRDPTLVDFGGDAAGLGRRLERLGGVLVDRPLAHATGPRRLPGLWGEATARFQAEASDRPGQAGGHWDFAGRPPEPWRVTVPILDRSISLEVHPAPSGQIGVFLEQIEQWQWLANSAQMSATILSLFGHSGGASLAAAVAGCSVVHVDASKQAVALARRNAEASGLAAAPISWICEDAATFVRRAATRGRRFSGVVLDPPSWGHGPKGQAFSIDRDLVPLLAGIARLWDSAAPGPILLTCHSPGWHHRRLRETLTVALRARGSRAIPVESGPLGCTDDSGRRLDLGSFARTSSSA